MIRELFDSFVRAWIRFWDNRFLENTLLKEIEYLKLEVEKERSEKNKLLNYILEMNAPKVEKEVDLSNFKPLSSSYVPFNVRRKKLEETDREKARQAKIDNEVRIEGMKSTEELEKELLG